MDDTGAESSVGNRALQRALSRRMTAQQTVLTDVTGHRLIADLGIMAAGAVTVPTYTTNTERDHAHILDNSGARAVIVSPEAAISVFTCARLARNPPPGSPFCCQPLADKVT